MLGPYNDGRNDIAAQEGNDLFLAIDGSVQALAESLLANRRGAVVAIDPDDGGVIALVSKPDYDLNSFGGVTPPDVWNALNTDSTKPLFNRATMTRYPPGSTFKMVLAAAAIEGNVVDPASRIFCTGGFRFGTRVFKDHGAPARRFSATGGCACGPRFYRAPGPRGPTYMRGATQRNPPVQKILEAGST